MSNCYFFTKKALNYLVFTVIFLLHFARVISSLTQWSLKISRRVFSF